MIRLLILDLLFAAPLMLVYLVGAIISLVNLKSHTKAATLAMLGCGLLLFTDFVFLFVHGYLNASLEYEGEFDTYPIVTKIVHGLQVLLHVAGFSLVLAGVFVGRRARPSEADRQRTDQDRDLPRTERDRDRLPSEGDPERDRGIMGRE